MTEITNTALSSQLIALLNPATGSATFFDNIISAAIIFGFAVGAIVFLFVIIAGAIQWMTAGGDKASMESARSKMSSGFVGIVLLFSAFAVLIALEIFFDTPLTHFNLDDYKIY